ncbi:DUF2703 domain-containing protein [bacterium]|nr:DUF2703 domain-containing protein [bacterium]MBU1983524.1 DUF2703 domain-containing protein [bacterium]
MKNLTLIATLLFALNFTVISATPDKPTLTLHYQPPAATIVKANDCCVLEAEVQKACKILRSKLRKSGIEVQLGMYSSREGTGQIWIDGKPLEEWLIEKPPCRVTAIEIVEAGLVAAKQLEENWQMSRQSASGAKTAVRGPIAAPAR